MALRVSGSPTFGVTFLMLQVRETRERPPSSRAWRSRARHQRGATPDARARKRWRRHADDTPMRSEGDAGGPRGNCHRNTGDRRQRLGGPRGDTGTWLGFGSMSRIHLQRRPDGGTRAARRPARAAPEKADGARPPREPERGVASLPPCATLRGRPRDGELRRRLADLCPAVSRYLSGATAGQARGLMLRPRTPSTLTFLAPVCWVRTLRIAGAPHSRAGVPARRR